MCERAKTDAFPDSAAGDKGFTLIEVVIALVILFVVVMGVFAAVTYSTRYNTGNNRRSQALAIFQREVELLRSAKFTPAIVSNVTTATPTCASADDGRRDITGGQKAAQVRCAPDGTVYLVETTIDDDPFTIGTQVAATPTSPSLKEITIDVIPQGTDGAWVNARRARMMLRRVRAN